MTPFSFISPGQIVFGRGVAQDAAALIPPLGTRVLMVRGSSVHWVETLRAELEQAGCVVTSFTGHGEPDIATVARAVNTGRNAAVDVVVAVGGGAVIDLGKATAALLPGTTNILDHLEGVGAAAPLGAHPVPFVAIPTTSGTGAEVTKNAVISVPDAGRKVSLRDDRMVPDIALVDPALTDDCPRDVTLASGFDAITQLVEPYLSHRANAMTDALVREALPQGLNALSRLATAEDAEARDMMSFASLMGGLALANAGLGAVHGLAGVVGGRFSAPHGVICARLLGPVLIENNAMMRSTGADTTRFEEIARLVSSAFDLPSETCFESLSALLDQLDVPRLSKWISADADLEAVVLEASSASSMKANPCVLPPTALHRIMQSAL
ncbi:MAG: iron-containing alcohol dehydrogenase [Roseobacter sp.]